MSTGDEAQAARVTVCERCTREPFISQEQALELIPGASRSWLAQLRFNGTGPRFYKPTPKMVLYKASEVNAWIQASAQTRTDKEDA